MSPTTVSLMTKQAEYTTSKSGSNSLPAYMNMLHLNP